MELVIKHDRAMDCCFEVEFFRFTEWGAVLRGRWWNMAFVESYPVSRDIVRIKKEEFDNWKICDNLDEICLRKSTWTKPIQWRPPKTQDNA